ncbi:MAG: hypothetical protein Q9227_006225 [Pyrenula ochraceoflavens]
MDPREIQKLGQNVVKAIQAHEPKENVIGLLRELQKGVKPTEDILRSTGIGKTVNKLKGSSQPEIARLASEIVSKWRQEINAQKPKLSSGTSTPNGIKPNGVKSASPAPTSAPPKPATPAIPPDKRNHKTDKVSLDKTDDQARNRCIGMMYDGLAQNSDTPSTELLPLAVAIENAAFQKFSSNGNLTGEYRDKLRTLFSNLRNKSNPKLRTRVTKGDITPERFVVMSHEEMKSKEQREEEKKIEKENMDKAMVAQEEKSISTSLQCSKCGQKKVSYTQAQTRSADEPMTTFCECMNCGNRWKFS